MLKKGIKKHIEDIVREQYSKMNPQNSNEKIKEKIESFESFLCVEAENARYSDFIKQFVEELEEVVIDERMISFYKVANINIFLEMVADLQEIEIEDKQYKLDAFKKLRIIKSKEIFDNIFKKENNNLIISENEMDKAEQYLSERKGEELIPFVKSYYICLNKDIFNKVENRTIPIIKYWDYCSNMFIAYLELADLVKDLVMEKYIVQKIKIDEYLKNIIDNYESKIQFKYIPSSVLKLDSNEITEDINNEDNNEEKLMSFIDINRDENLKKIKLIGYAGSGKTTTLEYIEYEDAKNYTEKIPVIISLITVENQQTVEELICKKLNINLENKAIVNYLIEKNKINLYLDGVNEISIMNNFEKRSFLDTLEEFIKRKKNANLKVIVTDRDNDQVSILNDCDTFLIQGMTDNDIDKFIEGNASKDKIEEIKRVIKTNEEFSEMVMQPIMIKNLITIIECGQKIPDDIEELSEVYLDSIINREIEDKKDLIAQYIKPALVYMVKKVTDRDDWTSNAPTSYYKVIDIFNEFARENGINNLDSENLLELIKKMGILKEVDFEKYAFIDEKFFHIFYYQAISE